VNRTIEFQLWIAAEPDEVWRLLAEPDGIPRWWDGLLGVEVGGGEAAPTWTLRYESGVPDECTVLERVPGSLLRYRWRSSEPEPTLVSYRLEPVEGGTRLGFENAGYGDGAAWERCYGVNFVGWLKMLLGLLALLEAAPDAEGVR
jgi:uncharacterized protein YndB with AHSA1/START domain